VRCGRAQELDALADLVKDHPRCLVMSDEIYEYIWFEAPPVSMASLPGMFERTITINGVSKGFAMTGWRVGYAAAPEPVARAIAKVQGTFTAGGNAFAQAGALAAITGPRDEVDKMRSSYKRRRDLAIAMLKGITGVERNRPSSDLLCAGRHQRPARPHRRQQAHRDRHRVLPLAAGRVSTWPPCRARPSAHRAASACRLPRATATSPRAWNALPAPPTRLPDAA
jgi:aspartate/methionine/tyrosine aminotransferase